MPETVIPTGGGDYLIDPFADDADPTAKDPLVAALGRGSLAAVAAGGATIGLNSRGDDAKACQEQLAALGYDLGIRAPDGWWAAGSMAALQKFQSDHALRPTGMIDQATVKALFSYRAEKGPAPALPAGRPSAPVGIRVAEPVGALERDYFDHEMERIGLGKALRDGVITEEEAKDVGIAMSVLQGVAAKGRTPGEIDGYEQVLELSPALPLAKDRFFAPGTAADYVVFAPREDQAKLAPLLNHRTEQGHRVALVDPQDVYAYYGKQGPEALAQFVKDAREKWPEPKLRYLLLVGSEVPQFPEKLADVDPKAAPYEAGFGADEFTSDDPYGLPDDRGVPQVAVGRLPVGDQDTLEKTVAKIIGYEAVKDPGLWQTRTALVDGDPGWGDFVGSAVAWFTDEEQKKIPETYDAARISLNPASGLAESAGDARAAVDRELQRGALLVSYVGHGGGLPVSAAARVDVQGGPPIVALSACSMQSDAEGLVAGENGAVAGVAASSISMPHTNAAWAAIFGDEVLEGRDQTLGDSFVRSKARFAANDVAGLSHTLNSLGQLGVGGGKAHLYLYNLIGDPATLVRRPLEIPRLVVLPRLNPASPSPVDPGKPFSLGMELPPGVTSGTAYVSVEKPLGTTELEDANEKGISDAEKSARIARNAERYNARSVATIAIPVVNGRLASQVTLPPNCPHGFYNLRVAVVGAENVAVGVVRNVPVGIHEDSGDVWDRSDEQGFP